MNKQIAANNLEICHEARAQLRGEFLASARTSKIACALQVLVFAASCALVNNLFAQDLQYAVQQEQDAKNSHLAAQAQNAKDLQTAAVQSQDDQNLQATQAQNAKNSQLTSQTQNAQESQIAPHTQNDQDLQAAAQQAQGVKNSQIAAQAQNAKNLQTVAKSQAAQDATAPQEKKENEMQQCDFYPVTDFFNLMEQFYNNLNKVCLLSRDTANLEATGLIIVDWSEEFKEENIPAEYQHNFYLRTRIWHDKLSSITVELFPHLLGRQTLIPEMKFPKNLPRPTRVYLEMEPFFKLSAISNKLKHHDLGLAFGEYKPYLHYEWIKLDKSSELYMQRHSLSYLRIFTFGFA